MVTFDRAGFLRALIEAEGGMSGRLEPHVGPRRPEAPGCIIFSLGESGGAALWAFAAEWTDEPTPPLTQPASAPTFEPTPSDSDMATIAQELGLEVVKTLRQLASRRRDFIWRNHPDRQPGHARARAGQRVALANALYDAARRKLAESS